MPIFLWHQAFWTTFFLFISKGNNQSSVIFVYGQRQVFFNVWIFCQKQLAARPVNLHPFTEAGAGERAR